MSKKLCSFSLALFLALAVFCCGGCSNTDNNENIENYGKIIIKHEDLPESVAYISYAVYAKTGELLSGPNDLEASDRYPFYSVPIYAKSLSIIYYNEDKEINYITTTPIAITAGERQEMTITAEDRKDIDNVSNLLGFDMALDARAHVDDTVTLTPMAAYKGEDCIYLQDYRLYAKWEVTQGSSQVATTDSTGSDLKKGVYRCVKTGTDPVEVKASLAKFSCLGYIDITSATISEVKLTADCPDLVDSYDSLTTADTLVCPYDAPCVPLYYVAKWSDGAFSAVNCISEWVTGDSRIVGCHSALGLLSGVAVRTTTEDGKEVAQTTVDIQGTCASNSSSNVKTCKAQYCELKLSSLANGVESVTINKGDSYTPVVYGVYGAETDDCRVLMMPVEYKLESGDETVVTVEDNTLTAVGAGTATVTASSVLNSGKKATFSVEVNP